MKRENLAFLCGGLAFGVLFGYGLFHTLDNTPQKQLARQAGGSGAIASPAGPMAPTQSAPGGSPGGAAPMIEEINALREVLQKDPNDLPALTRMANLYHDVGMWNQATVLYEKAIEVAPDNPDLLTDLGICYQELEQFDRALELFRRAQTADPEHWQSLYNTVVVAGFRLADYDEAEKALQKLEEVNPSAPNLSQLRQALLAARDGGSS